MTWTIRRILVLIIFIFSVAMIGTLYWVTSAYQSFTTETLRKETELSSEKIVRQLIENHYEQHFTTFLDEWSRLSLLTTGMQEQDAVKLNLAADRMFNTREITSGNVKLLSVAIYDRDMNLLTVSKKGTEDSLSEFPPSIKSIKNQSLAQKRLGFKVLWQTKKGRPVYSAIAAIGGFRLLGFIEFVTDPTNALENVGDSVGGSFELVDGAGEIIFRSDYLPGPKEAAGENTGLSTASGDNANMESYGVNLMGTDGHSWATAIISKDRSDFKNASDILGYQAIGVVAFVSLGIFAMAWLLLHFSVFTRIRDFADVLEALSEGFTDFRIPSTGRDEFGTMRTAILGLRTAVLRKLELQRKADEEIIQRTIMTRQLRASKEEAEAASLAKSEFLAAMSHEIRTPMSGVIGFADMLLEDPLEDVTKEKVYRIKDSTRALLKIINDILDMSKMDAGKMEIEYIDFDLRKLIDEVLVLFHKTRKTDIPLKLILNLSDEFPKAVMSDPTRIRQVLTNLLGNAFKFTAEGSVTVDGKLEETSDGTKMFTLSIQDTGIGIKESVLPTLFAAFTQADASITRTYDGTGLGLVISKRLVELMDGEIGVSSKLGEGSTFWFRLPYIPASNKFKEETSTRTVTQYVTRRPLNILIAEDNRINQRIIQATMEAYKHQVTIAENGQLTLEAHEKDDYDLILMDVRMPLMSGPEATEAIRALPSAKSQIPIIAVTADAMKEHQKGYLEIGMNAVVTKPIDRHELLQAINTVMNDEIHAAVDVEEEEPPAPQPTTDATQETDETDGDEDPDIADFLKHLEDVAEGDDEV